MQSNGRKKIIDKANFYFSKEIIAHVQIVPQGFKNGRFVSKLKEGQYFWFIELDTSIPIRLFISEIFDIGDYIPKEVGR